MKPVLKAYFRRISESRFSRSVRAYETRYRYEVMDGTNALRHRDAGGCHACDVREDGHGVLLFDAEQIVNV